MNRGAGGSKFQQFSCCTHETLGERECNKLVRFRAFQTKHSLMCKTHEQDKVSLPKLVLFCLMNVSDFFV
jgi:hypothetical protein